MKAQDSYAKLLEDQSFLLKHRGHHLFVRGSETIRVKIPEMEYFSTSELREIIARAKLIQIIEERDGNCRVKIRLEGNKDFKDGEVFEVPLADVIRVSENNEIWIEEEHGLYQDYGRWKHLKN